MSAALRLTQSGESQDQGPRGSEHGRDGEEMVRAWLDGLCAELRLPGADRNDVRDELACHIEERVRDLMVTGMAEDQAAARAIGELGDASVLARRLCAAHGAPRRRWIMNMAMIGMAGAAILGGAMVMRPAQPVVRSAVFEGAAGSEKIEAPLRVSVKEGDSNWQDLFAMVGKAAGKEAVVHWNSLQEAAKQANIAVVQGEPVNVAIGGVGSVDQLFESLNTEMGLDSNRIEYRDKGERIEIASTEYFDRREIRLVTYDVSGLVRERLGDAAEQREASDEAIEEITKLIQALVDQEKWVDCGGDMAKVYTYGTKLFVQAPRRMLGKIEWVLEQLGGAGGKDGKKGAPEASAEMHRRMDGDGAILLNRDLATTARVKLERVPAGDARMLLSLVFNSVPSLKQCAVVRVLEVDASEGTVVVTATPRQTEFAGKLLAMLDGPEGGGGGGGQDEMRTLPLQRISAEAAKSILATWMEMAPSLKGSKVRVSVDSQTNSLVLAGGVAFVQRAEDLVRLVDGEWAEGSTKGASIQGVREHHVPVLADVPLIADMFRGHEGAPLEIRAENGKVRVMSEDGSVIDADVIRVGAGN